MLSNNFQDKVNTTIEKRAWMPMMNGNLCLKDISLCFCFVHLYCTIILPGSGTIILRGGGMSAASVLLQYLWCLTTQLSRAGFEEQWNSTLWSPC